MSRVAAVIVLAAAVGLLLMLQPGCPADPDPTTPRHREVDTASNTKSAPPTDPPREAVSLPWQEILSLEEAQGLRLRGRVVDGGRHPLAGVTATLRPALERGWLDPAAKTGPIGGGIDGTEQVTGIDGTFDLHVGAAASFVLLLTHPRLPPLALDLASAPGDAVVRDLGDLQLRAGLGLVIEVVRRDGAGPVSGARVALSPVLFDPFLSGAAPRRLAVTDAGGEAIVYGLAAGDWRVRIEADGLATAERDHHQPPEAETAAELRLALDPGCSLGGRVLGPSGAPIQGAVLTIVPEIGAPIATTLRSGAGGEFRALGLPAGRVRVRAETTAFDAVEAEAVVLPRSERLELRFAPGLALAGRAVDAVTGFPVAGAVVEARRQDRETLVRAGRIVHPIARTGDDGSFRVGGLPPGRYALIFTSERHAPCESEMLEAEVAPSDERRFELAPAPEVEVMVTDADGSPLAGAEVLILPANHRGTALSDLLCRATRSADWRGVRTDAVGRARFPVTQPEFRLMARVPGRAAVFGDVERAPAGIARFSVNPLVCERGVVLSGRAVDASGQVVPRALLRAEPEETGSAHFEQVRADAEGHFEFPPLRAGSWVLSAPEAAGRVAVRPQVIRLGAAPHEVCEVRAR